MVYYVVMAFWPVGQQSSPQGAFGLWLGLLTLKSVVKYTKVCYLLIPFPPTPGPPPAVVASSTIAVVVVVVLMVVVTLSIVVIFVYIPYQSYKKRLTETANFSFIDLQMPTRWERFKIKLENWKNRVFKRDSRLGLINYSDVEEEDLLGNLYGSVNSRTS